MNVAIIGAGFTGLSAAYRLQDVGHQITLFERAAEPGGLALGFTHPKWDWTLEEYYHHWFTNDEHVLRLAQELSYPIVIKRPKTSTYVDGKSYQLDSPLHVLKFPKLSLADRIRMGAVLGFLKYDPSWKPLERYHADAVLRAAMGEKAYEMIWEPQLINKFGEYASDISLAWFWARIHKRTSSLAYPEGGFLSFARAVTDAITKKGGNVRFSHTISQIATEKNSITIDHERFDACIVTLPSFGFLKLFPSLPETYKQTFTPLKGIGAQVGVMRLSKQFLRDGTYWLSICNTKAPIMAVVEHTNFMDKSNYNNEHVVYLGNYLPTTDKRYGMDAKALLASFTPFLKTINPNFKKTLLGFEVFQTPFAQPIIPVNYSRHIPAMHTPLPHVYLANIQQVYPWDRGTNYAVELGERAASLIKETS